MSFESPFHYYLLHLFYHQRIHTIVCSVRIRFDWGSGSHLSHNYYLCAGCSKNNSSDLPKTYSYQTTYLRISGLKAGRKGRIK